MACSATIHLRPGSFNISPFLIDFILSQCRIVTDKGDGEKKKKNTDEFGQTEKKNILSKYFFQKERNVLYFF